MPKKKESPGKDKSQAEKNQRLNDWNDHLAGAKDKEFYSLRRIDILLITISGACIYIIFEFLKFMNTTDSAIDFHSHLILLKLSAIFSVGAIAVNFLSQIFGYHANRFEVLYSREQINQIEEGIDDVDCKLRFIDLKSKNFNSLTNYSNIISAIFMGVGIILLVIYNLLTF